MQLSKKNYNSLHPEKSVCLMLMKAMKQKSTVSEKDKYICGDESE